MILNSAGFDSQYKCLMCNSVGGAAIGGRSVLRDDFN